MSQMDEVFAQALELTDPDARDAFLRERFAEDAPELTEIQDLLRVYEKARGFLETPSPLLLDDLSEDPPVGALGADEQNALADDDHATRSLDGRLGKRMGRYTIQRQLGAGGMGTVYLGLDEELQRPVAIKFVNARCALDPKWLRRFEREAHTVATLNHPNVLTVHEIGNWDGTPCLVTEFVDGRTLRSLLKSGPLTLKFTLSISLQLARALAVAHEHRVIHRDLKPDNVMVRPDELVKVLDFGIARQLPTEFPSDSSDSQSSALTNPGQIQGTLRYMSPEQLRGHAVDERSDLFSLGCVIYEMLAGRTPFARDTDADSIAAVLNEQPLDIRSKLPTIPLSLAQIINKLLAHDPADRYQNAQDVIRDIMAQTGVEHGGTSTGQTESDGNSDSRSSASHTEETRGRIRPESGIASNDAGSFEELQVPDVHYAVSDDVNIAYQVYGSGPLDLIFVMGWVSHLDWFWKEPSFARFLRRLGDSCRVILFDKRGTGLSDRVPNEQLPTLEHRMDDVRAVMEAAGSDRAILCGVSEGGPLCSLFAATYPERTAALIMIGAYARRLRDHDYPWGPTEGEHAEFLEQIRRGWGGPVGIETRAPSRSEDPQFRRWWCDYLRMGASPGAAVALTRMNARVDVRPVLGAIRVPTLVIHRTGDMCLKVEEGRYLASRIPDARFVELAGADHLPFVGQQEEVLSAIADFLQNVRSTASGDRILATALAITFPTTPAASTAPTASATFTSVRRRIVDEFTSFRCTRTQIDDACLLATFDGPVRALRAALSIQSLANREGIRLQIGLTVGECWLRPHRVSGNAVDVAAQIAELAAPGTILASSTLRDLVPGSNIRFASPASSPTRLPPGVPLLLQVLG